MSRVSVFGMGYVGCVTAACLSRDGHHVIGVDVDEEKIGAIRAGTSPVVEPGLDQLVRDCVASGQLEATTDSEQAVRDSEIALITVGTPSADDGSVEYHTVERVVESIGKILYKSQQNYAVVIRSTLCPGILEEHLRPALEDAAGRQFGPDLVLCNNPEFLRETTAISDYDKPPFVLVGAAEPLQAAGVLGLFQTIHAEQIVTDTRTAALVKYACNAFHALKIAFANEIGSLAKATGADGLQAMDVLCRDHRLNISPAYLRPGFAFGGSCLPKDLRAIVRLAQEQAVRADLLSAILPSNESHLARGIRRIQKAKRKKIGLVGLSFKAGTDDLRESPPVALAETLLGRGYELRIYDPGVRLAGLRGTNLAYIDQHLPHLAALLVDAQSLYEHAELLVLATNVADTLDWNAKYFGEVIDLRCDLVSPTSRPQPASRLVTVER